MNRFENADEEVVRFIERRIAELEKRIAEDTQAIDKLAEQRIARHTKLVQYMARAREIGLEV